MLWNYAKVRRLDGERRLIPLLASDIVFLFEIISNFRRWQSFVKDLSNLGQNLEHIFNFTDF